MAGATGARLGRGIVEVLDLGQPVCPLNADIQRRIGIPDSKVAEVAEECRHILGAGGKDICRALLCPPQWLENTLRGAGASFGSDFSRWPELYGSAVRQRDEARPIVDNPTTRNN
jgi:hypothetical protein